MSSVQLLRRLTGAMTIRNPACEMLRSKSKMNQGKKAMKAKAAENAKNGTVPPML